MFVCRGGAHGIGLFYPVEGGSLEVEVGPDGDYEIKAVLKASECEFEYEYEGPLDTYDLSGMRL